MVFISDWLISLSLKKKPFQVRPCCWKGKIVFYFMAKQCSTVWTDHSFFTHSSPDGPSGCFQLSAVVNAAVSIVVHVFFQTAVWLSSHIFPQVELLGHMAVPFLSFWGNSHCFPQWLHPSAFPQQCRRVPFSPQPRQPLLVDDGHSDRCEVISPCAFNLHLPDD